MQVMLKLEYFKDVVLSDAEQKRQAILTDMEDKLNIACINAKEQALKRQEEIVKKVRHKAEMERNKCITEAATMAKRELVKLRIQEIEKLFEEVKNNLEDFVKTDEYKEQLLDEIKKYNEQYKNFIVYITKKDMIYIDFIKQHIDVTVEESDEDFIGGFKIKLVNKMAIIDNSYKTMIEEERNNFRL